MKKKNLLLLARLWLFFYISTYRMQPDTDGYDDDYDDISDVDINDQLLTLTRRVTSDLYTGVESKTIWTRDKSCEHKRLHYETELTYFHKYHIYPHLLDLVQTDAKHFFWLGAEIQFSKDDDEDEICSR